MSLSREGEKETLGDEAGRKISEHCAWTGFVAECCSSQQDFKSGPRALAVRRLPCNQEAVAMALTLGGVTLALQE